MAPPRSPSRAVDRAAAADAIDAFLRALGLDPSTDPELRGTGARVAEAWIDDICSGYDADVDSIVLGSAIAGPTQPSPGVVMVRGINVATMCPHHLMPAIGTADVAFGPNATLIGVGAIARVVHALARRLVLQEVLGESIATALHAGLSPRWVACRLDLEHACFVARGEREHGARVVTLALRGEITPEAALTILGGGADGNQLAGGADGEKHA